MPLQSGTRLGPYTITAAIGVGGMGEVYRARDTSLNRDVAVKVLPEAVADDADRLARFQREAEALAALNHPNIAQVYGLERSVGSPAIVMELIEGPTLADRLKAGPLSLDEALPIARQIAEALEAAHERGIVHRDLKPGNIKVTEAGTVKVLDFGLAKALAPEGVTGSAEASEAQTVTSPAVTQMGVILGTAAYMSPEQAKGRHVDKRADVWAFGVVLFEMLTGRRPFAGDDVSEVMARVIEREPEWSALPTDTPAAVSRMLRRCLVKPPRDRLHDIGDARLDLDDALGGDEKPHPDRPRTSSRERWVWSMTVAVLALGLAGVYLAGVPGRPTPELTSTHVLVSPADGLLSSDNLESVGDGRPSRTAMAFSPNGRQLVLSGVRDGHQQLFLRALDRLNAEPIANTEGADNPFFSPDGTWIGFWSDGALRKIPVAGGAATTLCDTGHIYGASWSSTGVIVFAQGEGALWQVPEDGGTPAPLTTLDDTSAEYSHRLPHVLPDGRTVVFTVVSHGILPNWNDTRLAAVSIDGGAHVDLGAGADARYAATPTGHLVFMRSGTLVAAPFDPAHPTQIGRAVTVLPDVMQAANMPNSGIDTGAGQFSVSTSGSLAYVPGGIYADDNNRVLSLDRRGQGSPLQIPPGPWIGLDLSPDDTTLLLWRQGLDRSVWTYDLERGFAQRLNLEGRNHRAIWTPDGTRIVFTDQLGRLMWSPADGSAAPEPVAEGVSGSAGSWTPDGTTLLFLEAYADILAVPPGPDNIPTPIVQTPSLDLYPDLDPSGQYLAYTSDVEGTSQVYVQPFSGGRRDKVSPNGGTSPAWSADGRELFYFEGGLARSQRLMVVPIISLSPFTAGIPRLLFERELGRRQAATRGWDVTSDGQRFFVIEKEGRPLTPVTQIVFVQTWFEEVERLVPAR